jgi:GAF domain-containing protein
MFLPLVTRGEPFGGLSLAMTTSDRGYTQGDLEFAELVAGRVAIVLDHVGLTEAAERTERRMVAALDTLDEAVTMNGPDGRTVYVNDAAVRLLKARSADELVNGEVGEISARFALYDEAGRPLDFRALPAFRALAGEDDPPALLVRNVVRATGEERWLLNKVSVLRDARGHVDRVVNVIEDLTEIKQAELRERLLAEASRALSRSLEYERTLQQVAEVAVPELADWCAVDLPGELGQIDSVAIAHSDPTRVALGRELRERYPVRLDADTDLARVVRDGGTARIDGVRDEDLVAFAADPEHLRLLREVGFGAILIVPLVAGGEPLGALTLVRSDPLRRFSATDVALAEDLGRRAGIAVLNARLYGERTRIARELQAGVRPPELLPLSGLEVASLYRPASQLDDVGGDFYDAFPTPRGWMVVIGDVAGQGARAAALTGLARYTLRSVGQITGDPLAAVGQVNRTLRDQPEMSLCTVAVLLMHRDEAGRPAVAAVSCGHPLPVLIRDGVPAELGAPGALLGAFDEAEAGIVTTPLAEGDALVLYTDGVLDAVGADERFGEGRLRALLHGPAEHADAVVRRVDEALSAFQAGPQADDTAVVAIAVRDVAALTEALPDEPQLAPPRPANGL